MHFWVFAARGYGGFWVPRKYGLNWFMPALVNKSVGSSCGTTGLDGTNVWPCFFTKKSMNCWRISLAVSMKTGPCKVQEVNHRGTENTEKTKAKSENRNPKVSDSDFGFE